MDWTKELAELFGRANTKGIHTAIQGLRTKYNYRNDISIKSSNVKININDVCKLIECANRVQSKQLN
jgi:hypothetical protein